jgi:hypothetical protein
MKELDPNVFILLGSIVILGGFFLIDPYSSAIGPVENAILGSIPISDFNCLIHTSLSLALR